MIKKLFIGNSTIPNAGTGLFAGEDIRKCDVVMIWSMECFIISEQDYNEEQKKGNKVMIDTGARFVDGYFLYTDTKPRLENHVNHSFDSNMLYHCGVCFAKKDILKGEELTVDYRYVLAKGDAARFVDTTTGATVDGVDSLTCLKETTEDLLNLLKQE
jgi:hypothetical protein